MISSGVFSQTYAKLHHTTHPQFNVLSGGLIECLEEPWHVGVCAAGSLTTTTLLPIPQCEHTRYYTIHMY